MKIEESPPHSKQSRCAIVLRKSKARKIGGHLGNKKSKGLTFSMYHKIVSSSFVLHRADSRLGSTTQVPSSARS